MWKSCKLLNGHCLVAANSTAEHRQTKTNGIFLLKSSWKRSIACNFTDWVWVWIGIEGVACIARAGFLGMHLFASFEIGINSAFGCYLELILFYSIFEVWILVNYVALFILHSLFNWASGNWHLKHLNDVNDQHSLVQLFKRSTITLIAWTV